MGKRRRRVNAPATIPDSALAGAAIAVGSSLPPTLTTLIASNHIELAKTFIIVTYCATALLVTLMGAAFAAIGQKYIPTAP